MDLIDMHNGFPVIVESDHREYSESLTSDLESLDVGNIITAELQSEDILQIDGIWRYLEFSLVDNSIITFLDEGELPEDRGQQIGYDIVTSGGAYFEYSTDEEDASVVLIGGHLGESDWIQSRLDPYREIFSWFSEPPPYEIIHQKIPEHDFYLSYHISEQGTNLAQSLRED